MKNDREENPYPFIFMLTVVSVLLGVVAWEVFYFAAHLVFSIRS